VVAGSKSSYSGTWPAAGVEEGSLTAGLTVVASKETKTHGTAHVIPSRVVSAGSGESRRGKQDEGQRHGSHSDDERPTHVPEL